MSFETALSGVAAAQAHLDIVSNNIANVNSTGFKKSRAEFGEIFAQTRTGLSSTAIGQGTRLTAINQQFTQGSIEATNNNLDMAIDGNGFFILSDANGATTYSRAGIFQLDEEGFVTNSSGLFLNGFSTNSTTGETGGTLGTIQFDTSNLSPTSTSTATMDVNLDAGEAINAATFDATDPSTYTHTTSVTIYDSLGTSHIASQYFTKTAANSWDSRTFIDGNAVGGATTLTFDTSGALTAAGADTTAPLEIALPAYTPAGAAAINLSINLTDTSQLDADFSVTALSQNGNPTGIITDINISNDGSVFANFSNGESRVLSQIGLANFTNQQGLESIGNSQWRETRDSGLPRVGQPNSAELGLIRSGSLEAANVNISRELVDLILAQRNFQANSQSISTENTVTQTILNI